MAKRRDWIISIIIGGSVLLFVIFIFAGLFTWLSKSDSAEFSGFGDRVAIIDVQGVITSSDNVIRQLKKYTAAGNVRALVLRIESPGGGVAAAQEIHEEVKKVRERGKKVVASMGSVAASGGYYIACAADSIVANPGTLTGSIGVIFEFPILEDLLKKIGVRWEVIKSGEMKDIGSFSRKITEKERKHLQSVIDDTYEQFVNVLVANRNLPKKKVLALADGSIFTGQQAQKLGLVDQLGNMEDAIKLAGKMAGIQGEPKTIKERKRRLTLFDILSEGLFKIKNFSREEHATPRLLYLFQ